MRTGWEADTPSTDTVVLAGARAIADGVSRWAVAAGGTVTRVGPVVVADAGSPCPFVNQVIALGPLDVALAAEVAATVPPERGFGLFSPLPTPDLAGVGLELVGHPPFMFRPPGGDGPALPPGVAVEEVADADGLRRWAGLVAEAFPAPGFDPPAGLLAAGCRCWLATVDGEPAGAAAARVGHGLVDVEWVATLPAFRGRGVGAAVTWAATTADPALPAVLLASDPGRPVYERLGYLPLVRWTMWWRAPSGMEQLGEPLSPS